MANIIVSSETLEYFGHLMAPVNCGIIDALKQLGECGRIVESVRIRPFPNLDQPEGVVLGVTITDALASIGLVGTFTMETTSIEVSGKKIVDVALQVRLRLLQCFISAVTDREAILMESRGVLYQAMRKVGQFVCPSCGNIMTPDQSGRNDKMICLVCPKTTPVKQLLSTPSTPMTDKTTIGPGLPSTMFGNPPTCPSCGHVGVLRNGVYKCLNCGESLGTKPVEGV